MPEQAYTPLQNKYEVPIDEHAPLAPALPAKADIEPWAKQYRFNK